MTVRRLGGLGWDGMRDEVYKFVPPVAPDLAARWAGVEIDLAKITLPNQLTNDWLIVEGAGGVLVPINQKQFILDMAGELKMSGIFVGGSSRGRIKYTFFSLAALAGGGITVGGGGVVGG